MSWAIGFNAALKSGLDTWNKLSEARKIAARDEADAAVKANNAAADSDVKAYGQAATDAMSTNSLDAAYKTFGGDDYKNLTDSQKRAIADELAVRGLYNPNTGVYNARGVAEMYQPKAQPSALSVGAGAPVSAPSTQPVPVANPAAPVALGGVGSTGAQASPQAPVQTAIPQWQSDIANNARVYGDEAANRNRLIQQDLGESVQRRMKTLGDDNAQAMHTYNSWYNPDALDKEDEYKLNQGFRLLGRAVANGDAGAQSLLVAGYNAMNPGAKILSNGDGTYSMADANGNPTGKPFVPSVAQMGQTMTQLYNVARAIKTADFDKLSESMLKAAQTRYANANADIADANALYATENAWNTAEGKRLANEGQKNANVISESNAKYQDEKNARAINQMDIAIKKTLWDMNNGDLLTKLKAQALYQQLVIERAKLAAYQQRTALAANSGKGPGITFTDPDENGTQMVKDNTGKVIAFSSSNGVYLPPNDKDGRITAELTRQGNNLGLGIAYVPGDGGFAIVKDGYVVKGANGADLRGLTAGGVSSALKQIGVKAGGKGAKASKGPSKAPQRAIDLPEYGY
jgi:hypothetical protein